MDWKLELIVVPVADVDRAKAFYSEKTGFAIDVDYQPSDNFRLVQLTPPGSACSIAVMRQSDRAGSLQGLQVVVSDIEQARAELEARGVEVSELWHMDGGNQASGSDPNRADYASFFSFSDPDGNGWLIQEVRSRG